MRLNSVEMIVIERKNKKFTVLYPLSVVNLSEYDDDAREKESDKIETP